MNLNLVFLGVDEGKDAVIVFYGLYRVSGGHTAPGFIPK
jgi:hypothetical protein